MAINNYGNQSTPGGYYFPNQAQVANMSNNLQGNNIPQSYQGYNQQVYSTPYNNFLQGQQNLQQNMAYLKCRPVSSKDQARAQQIDLDGSLWVFTDIGNNRIYTKQINNDGTASFKTYVLTQEPKEQLQNSSQYVTKQQFKETIQAIMAAIQPSQGMQSVKNETMQKASGSQELVF